jgi:hypothetical protein
MRAHVFVIFLAPLLIINITACERQEQALPFETIAKGDGPGLTKFYEQSRPGLLIISNTEDVNALAKPPDDLSGTGLEPQVQQLRALDYDRYFAILVLHGLRGSTRFSVTVQKVTRRSNQITVWADFQGPASGESVGDAFTSPYHLVAIPKETTWPRHVEFVLVDSERPVAWTTHFVP